jgi:hypothetical protein
VRRRWRLVVDPWVVFGWVAALSLSAVVLAITVVIVIGVTRGLRGKPGPDKEVFRG